jgi:restriction endonuclease S subunit
LSEGVLIALIAAAPPTAAAILGYLAHQRSLRRSLGTSGDVPLAKVIEGLETRSEGRFDRLETKVDRVLDQHGEIRERMARMEAERVRPGEVG